jgi:hypothetical protein
MKSEYLLEAIKKLKPTAEFSFTDRDSSTIVWDKIEGNPPTEEEIIAAVIEVQNELEVKQTAKAHERAALLERLGITADEARLLLGGN